MVTDRQKTKKKTFDLALKSKNLWLLLPLFCGLCFWAWNLILFPKGYADNGDFWRQLNPAGLQYFTLPKLSRYEFFSLNYYISNNSSLSSLLSSSGFFTYLLTKAVKLFTENFDIRIQSSIFLALFSWGLILIYKINKPIFWILFFLYIEPSNFLYFNSFFPENLLLALMPFFFYYCFSQKLNYKVLFILNAIFVFIKPLYILFPLLIFAFQFKKSPVRPLIISTVTPIALAILVFFVLPISKLERLSLMNKYQSLTRGYMALVNNPKERIQEMGISSDFIDKEFTNLSEEEVFLFQKQTKSISFFSIFSFYFFDVSIWQSLFSQLKTAIAVTPIEYLGNYPSSDMAGKNFRYFGQYSMIRDPVVSSLLNYWPIGIIFSCLGFFLAKLSRKKEILFFFIFFTSQVCIALIGDGLYSIHRHLSVARIFFDLSLLLVLLAYLERIKLLFFRKA
ncbi:MAG: hypothetical protein M9962_09240 [Oligoflexia bacterium]|nr:hypothetical protein [Oligoflexia bacterium]